MEGVGEDILDEMECRFWVLDRRVWIVVLVVNEEGGEGGDRIRWWWMGMGN